MVQLYSICNFVLTYLLPIYIFAIGKEALKDALYSHKGYDSLVT